MRAREFEMADAYTFDATREGMLASVEDLNAACRSALTRMGLPRDTGDTGRRRRHLQGAVDRARGTQRHWPVRVRGVSAVRLSRGSRGRRGGVPEA